MSTPVQQRMNARFGFNCAKYEYSAATSNVNYDFNLKLNAFVALLDYFPTGSELRIGGGLVYNNKIDATGRPTPSATCTINGNLYAAATAARPDGAIDFHKVAPFLGVGRNSAVRKQAGWGFSADRGIRDDLKMAVLVLHTKSWSGSYCSAPEPKIAAKRVTRF